MADSELDYPNPQEMQIWLENEITDIMKAAELRTREATNFVNAYARGELTMEQASKRGYEYSNRWGEALPGIQLSRGQSDEEILKRMEEAEKERVERRRRGGNDTWRGGL